MKFILTTLFAALMAVQVQAGDGFDKLFSKYADSDDITTVNLTETMLKIASKFVEEDDVEARELLSSIKSVKVLVAEHGKLNGLFDEAMDVLRSGNYEDLVRVNDSDERVRIAVEENGEIIKDVIILAESSNEIAFVNITGDINPNQVGKVLKTLDIKIDGMDVE